MAVATWRKCHLCGFLYYQKDESLEELHPMVECEKALWDHMMITQADANEATEKYQQALDEYGDPMYQIYLERGGGGKECWIMKLCRTITLIMSYYPIRHHAPKREV